MRIAIAMAMGFVAACAVTGERGEMRYYQCDDGSAFNVEVMDRTIKLHTATGVIELGRTRNDGPGVLYSNGLRSVELAADGSARHAIGRRAWANCTVV